MVSKPKKFQRMNTNLQLTPVFPSVHDKKSTVWYSKDYPASRVFVIERKKL